MTFSAHGWFNYYLIAKLLSNLAKEVRNSRRYFRRSSLRGTKGTNLRKTEYLKFKIFVKPKYSPKSKSQIQVPISKFKVQRKGTGTGADTIILQATFYDLLRPL